jgi:hypothetical protein
MALEYLQEFKVEDLSEEQIQALVKIYVKYRMQNVVAFLLYFGFLFFANFTTVILNEKWIHNGQFQFLFILGNTLLVLTGFRGTIIEQRDILVENAVKVVYSDEK